MKTKPKNSIKERDKKVPLIKINPRKNRKQSIPIEVKLFVQMQADLIKKIDESLSEVESRFNLGLYAAKRIIQNYKPDIFKK